MTLRIKGPGLDRGEGEGNRRDKPALCVGCPLYKTGEGFVPGSYQGKPVLRLNANGNLENLQDISNVKLSFCGEAPALDELLQKLPFVGKTGQLLRRWVFGNAGVNVDEVFIDNTIRCAQPDNKMPQAKILAEAARHCEIYDRWPGIEADVLTLHPASLLRDIVPLPLVVADVGKARRLSEKHFIRILAGQVAAAARYPFASSIRNWRGSIEWR